jgi:hypothetical protein
MRCRLVLFLLFIAPAVRAQDACPHRTRNAFIGGAVGAVVPLALFAIQERHVDSGDALPLTWGAAWGATIGSTLALAPRECRRPEAAHVYRNGCTTAARNGAAKGAMGGGLIGFLVGPLVVARALEAGVVRSRAA